MISKLSQQRGHIALISVYGDPSAEVGRDGAEGQAVYVRRVGEALAQLGWQVDMFTRTTSSDQAAVVEHFPGCRTIRLQAGPMEFIECDRLFDFLPDFLKSFLDYQSQTGVLYPMIHTHYWLSAWVGMELRKKQTLRMLHTYHSLELDKSVSMNTIPAITKTRSEIESQCLETADCVVATSVQEQNDMRSLVAETDNITVVPSGTDIESWKGVATQLDMLYLNQLWDLHHEFFEGSPVETETPHLTVVESLSKQIDPSEPDDPSKTAIAV